MSLRISAIDPLICPLCKAANACAAELERATGQVQPPCWCMTAVIPAALLDRVPPGARGQACVCRLCAAEAQAAPAEQG